LSGKLVDRYVWTLQTLEAPPCDFSYYYVDAESGEIVANSFSSCGAYCLSGNTSIETPNGQINIKELKIGMIVWTLGDTGLKQLAAILKTKVLVPSTHKMVHLTLNDGRELLASPGHPTTESRFLGELKVGDNLDNAKIKSIELVSYNENYTYDILPSGPTGFYWANGILVGSTLK